MTLTAEEIMKIMEKARALGVDHLEVEGLKVGMGAAPKAQTGPVPEVPPEELIKPISVFDTITDEEILYYSTPYYDQIQANKEAHKKALEEKAKESA